MLPLEPWELTYFEEELAAAEQAPQDIERFKEASLGYIDDVVVALERFESTPMHTTMTTSTSDRGRGHRAAVVLRRTAPGAPAVNPFRDVGRNDPCPCGSGKKAKRCCLAA